MLTSAYVWLGVVLAQSETPAPSAPAGSGGGAQDFVTSVVAPILGTGIVGALFLMVIFRIKVMPTYVHDEAIARWASDRERLEASHAAELARVVAENGELKQAVKDGNLVYTQQVIPTLTRVLDAERELVDLRRDEAAERRRRAPAPD